jgi:HPt (histidine-containing phosphotransfer) domain-containing protein
MNGYLMKPVSPSALIDCVRERLGSVHETTPRHHSGLGQALDVELLREEARHFAPGAIGRFLDNLATSINEVLPLVQGWVTSDPADIKGRLHNLAGVAGTLGCTRLSEVARLLETAPTVTDELLEQFADAAQASLIAIRQHLA